MKGVFSPGLCGNAHATNLRGLGVGGGVGATALVNLLLQLVHVTWFPLAACFRARREEAPALQPEQQRRSRASQLRGASSDMVGGSTVSGFGAPHQTASVSTCTLPPCTHSLTGRNTRESTRERRSERI